MSISFRSMDSLAQRYSVGFSKGGARKRLTQCVRARFCHVYGFADIPASIPFRTEPSDLDIPDQCDCIPLVGRIADQH